MHDLRAAAVSTPQFDSFPRNPAGHGAKTWRDFRSLRRGTFHSAEELERAIYQWLARWNDEPKPFLRRAAADVILDKVRRCKQLAGRHARAFA